MLEDVWGFGWPDLIGGSTAIIGLYSFFYLANKLPGRRAGPVFKELWGNVWRILVLILFFVLAPFVFDAWQDAISGRSDRCEYEECDYGPL